MEQVCTALPFKMALVDRDHVPGGNSLSVVSHPLMGIHVIDRRKRCVSG
ncbi:hypothetical protein NKL07_00585 [Mesorhizobium sp. C280B]|nr:hypothetical protein [Mesorhizobium sp. LSJC280B00]ESW62744.1 hypothetical protein X772_36775 [Mesorhizobium sp. LSJC280B00]